MFDLIYRFIFFISIFILLFSGCSSSPKFTKENDTKPKTIIKDPPNIIDTIDYRNVSILETEVGTASYYADDFHGKLTANGEIYDMNGISAAHPSYPLGTMIIVTNLQNEKSVTLKINDRMPKHPSRIIDLSLGTAKKLDMVSDGLAEVRIDVIEWGDNSYKKQD